MSDRASCERARPRKYGHHTYFWHLAQAYCEHYCVPKLNGKGAVETVGTWDLSTICLRVSLIFKAHGQACRLPENVRFGILKNAVAAFLWATIIPPPKAPSINIYREWLGLIRIYNK